MTTPATREYLFVPDVQALRNKIAHAHGTVAYLWKSLQALPYADGNGRYYPAFLYLVTGREEYARAALAELKSAMEIYRAGDLSLDVHFHTWCNSAPMARLAVMFDWIADSPEVSAEDAAAIKEAILDYTLKHPYNIAKSRTLTFDNQISAMSFCCALVGYLFGVKRGTDMRAQRLLDAGIMRFPDIFALSPKGGYSGEGSTYFCQIVAPVASWYCALMEQITGEEVFSRPFPPSNLTPEEVLRTYHKILGPSGLMPPWDHYGWMRCASIMGLAYLARKTGDAAPLAAIERLGLGAEPGYIAWGSDDKLWTLIWWPENLEVDASAEAFPSWAIPNVGGALVEERQAWRLFQAWDTCAPSVYCGRAQVNPNMITLDCWGSPIFTDGIPGQDVCAVFDYPLEAFRAVMAEGELESITNYHRTFIPGWDPKNWVKGFAYGLVGGSNSIVVNDEGQYSPAESREGRLTAFADLPNLKLIASEVAEYYRPRYPIASMVRTSLLVRDAYYLVRDTIRTEGPSLRFDWQVFARGEVTATGNRVHILTPEGVHVDILPLNPQARVSLTEVPGFPRGIENRSTRIRYRADGAEVDLPFLVVPRRPMAPVADLREGWSPVRMGQAEGVSAGLPCGVTATASMPANEIGLIAGDGKDGWVWAGRAFEVTEKLRGQRLFLHVASRIHGLQVWVNGQAAPLPDSTVKSEYAGGGWYVPATVEITGLVRAGANTLVLAGQTCQGKLVNGPVELMTAAALPELPNVTVRGRGHYVLEGPHGRDEIILADAAGAVTAGSLTAQAQAVLLTADGAFAALQTTRLSSGGVQCWSDRPVDLACGPGIVTLGDLSGPETVEIAHPDFHLRLQSRGALDVDLTGRALPRVTARLVHDKPVFVNGRRVAAGRNPYTGRLVIAAAADAPPSDPSMPAYVHRLESLMRLAATGSPAAIPRLVAALDDPDWKVEQVAAELLGQSGAPEAIAPLLARLEREKVEDMYRYELPAWAEALRRYRENPAAWSAGAGSSADAVKRHRLKAIIVEALGRLRAKAAVPALCRIVEDQREFYPVHCLACQALGRIGDSAALPTLQKASHYAEVNTKYRAHDAIVRITAGRPAHPDYPDRSGA